MQVLRWFTVLILVPVMATRADAQGPQPASMALGGASVSIMNGLDGLGANPASLFLQQKNERYSAVVYQPASFFSGPDLGGAPGRALLTSWFDAGRAVTTASDTFRLARPVLFRGGSSTGHFTGRSDVLLFAAAYRSANRTLAVHARRVLESDSRYSRGWFTALTGTETGTVHRNLEQQIRARTEIGVTFAGPMQVLSGLQSNFNQLVYGFSPRFILAGAHFSGLYTGRISGGRGVYGIQSEAGGVLADAETALRNGAALPDASSWFEVQGYGAALDLGVAYVMPGGRDFSLFNINAPASYLPGIRLGFAVRDLGYVRYRPAQRLKADTLGSVLTQDGLAAAARAFTGQPGAFSGFLMHHADGRATLNRAASASGRRSELMAPTVQAGFSAANRWVTFTLESSFRVTYLATDEEVWQTHAGLELRPLRWLPLRGGVLYQRDLPLYYSAGAGLNNRYVQASAGVLWFSDPARNDQATRAGLSWRFLVRL